MAGIERPGGWDSHARERLRSHTEITSDGDGWVPRARGEMEGGRARLATTETEECEWAHCGPTRQGEMEFRVNLR
jgi:hypothetical protein